MLRRKRHPLISSRWPVILILLLAYGLMLSSAIDKSPTVDEQSHLFRGVAYLKMNATHFLLGHPLLGSVISALPLLTEPDARLPTADPAWAEGNWSLAGDAFLWRVNDNPQRLVFLGRLPVMWLTLLLGALVYRWGRELAGWLAGLLAAVLLLLDPNVLAHGRLITGDLPLALFFALAVYGYWRWAKRPNLTALLLTGIGLGVAGATKYNAVLLLPILGLMGLVLVWRWRSWRPLAALFWAGVIGGWVIWGVYRFAMRPYPGGAFWEDLFWELQYFGKPHGAYLAGRYSTDGWWYYFPVTFLLKTPLPTLILLLWAFLRKGNGRNSSLRQAQGRLFILHPSSLFLLLPPAFYFAVSLTSSLNIGYRYLLPIQPFLILFAAVTLAPSLTKDGLKRTAVFALGGWLLLTTLLAWPDYIPYFNLLAGDNGWRILSDSNVDWGQDLPALADWQKARGEPVKLSYFGMAHPTAYGIEFESLPTWPPGPEQANPAFQVFNPADPAPGLYAISVTNLHGMVLGEGRDTYAWFRDQEPLARIGGSIFLYEVKPRGEPVDVAFAGLRPAELAPELHESLGTNDVRVRWFDERTSLIWPAGGGWLASSAGQALDDALVQFWSVDSAMFSAGETQSLYELSYPPPIPWRGDTAFGGTAIFLGYSHLYDRVGALEPLPGEVNLITGWRVLEATDRPLKLFVHALDENGQILGQWDGLDVAPASWQPGDIFVQLHRFPIPETAVPVSFAIGMYDGATLERLADPVIVPR